jgi:hypothetical protein
MDDSQVVEMTRASNQIFGSGTKGRVFESHRAYFKGHFSSGLFSCGSQSAISFQDAEKTRTWQKSFAPELLIDRERQFEMHLLEDCGNSEIAFAKSSLFVQLRMYVEISAHLLIGVLVVFGRNISRRSLGRWTNASRKR